VSLGEIDASHSFQVFDYWARNRPRYPGKTHVAVLVAENATRRYRLALEALAETVPLIVIESRTLKGNHEAVLVPEVVVHNASLDLADTPAGTVGQERTEQEWRELLTDEAWAFKDAASYGELRRGGPSAEIAARRRDCEDCEDIVAETLPASADDPQLPEDPRRTEGLRAPCAARGALDEHQARDADADSSVRARTQCRSGSPPESPTWPQPSRRDSRRAASGSRAEAEPAAPIQPSLAGTRVGTGWEQIASSRGVSCPLVSSRNLLPCRRFPGGNRRADPLGPPPSKPTVGGSNPPGGAFPGLFGLWDRRPAAGSWSIGPRNRPCVAARRGIRGEGQR
jgi:hypothetical protein